MATLADFRLRIAAKIGLDNSVSGDQPLIDSWVNEAVAEVLTRSRTNVAVGAMNLTAGDMDYQLPTEILALDEIYVTPVGSTQPYLMYRKSPLEIIQMRIGASGGTPPVRFYALNGSILLMIYPTPTAADVLSIYYVPRPAQLVVGTQSPTDIPAEWHKVIEYYGCWQAAQFSDSSTTQEGNLYRALYEDELSKLRRGGLHRGGRKLSPAKVGRWPTRQHLIGSPDQQGV